MKIFYAFSGHGHGHGVRSSVVIKFLRKLGHEVKAATYGQGLQFARQSKLSDVVEIEGFRQYYNKKGLSVGSTLLKFFSCSPKVIFSNLTKFRQIMEFFQPDLIISDFEPFSAYWAKWKDIPLIEINNQSIINLAKLKIPARYYVDYLGSAALVVALFTPPAQANFILSFSPELTPIKKRYRKNTFLVPPILREEIFTLSRESTSLQRDPSREAGSAFMLVYQTSPVYQKKLIQTLSQFPEIKFYIYNLNFKTSLSKNLIVKNFSEREFLNDLINCQAVIANGGFTLMSEAIYLGKPMLSWPIKNDFEQILNAILLEKSGYGKFVSTMNTQIFEEFLNNLNLYKNNLKNYHQDKNKIFEEKLKNILIKIKPIL
jgi:uncharacterized protein (TIGR00661 family)